MSECERCLTEKQDRTIQGKQIELCLDFDCLAERMLAEYEGCNHSFQKEDEHLWKCQDCGMGQVTTPKSISK